MTKRVGFQNSGIRGESVYQPIRIFGLLAYLLASFVPSVWAQESDVIPNEPAQFHLFVLAGQSNMAGRGKVAAEDKQIDHRVWMLDKSLNWVPAVDPLHFDKPKAVGVGLGKSFAIDYANAHPGIQVGLIPCAVGGSPITAWTPGGFHDQTQSHPWDDCVTRVHKAMEFGVLKGFLWHQGESDSRQGSAAKYEERLTKLIKRFRDTFSAPTIPFLIGQLGRFDGRPWNEYREQVDAAQQEVAQTLPHCGFVSSDGLGHRGDHLHFDAASAREFGHRYYQVYAKMYDDRQQMLDKLGISKVRPGRRQKASAENAANYDEANANPFPDWPNPLTLDDGKTVATPETWWSERRPQIVESFEREVYGRVPADVPSVKWVAGPPIISTIAGTTVIQQQITGAVDNSEFPAIEVKIEVTLFLPTPSGAPVPVLVMIDPIDRLGADEHSRPDGRIADLIAAGWAVAVMNPWSVQADSGTGLTSGVIGLANHGQPRRPDQWGALRAWAWGASRVFDFLQGDPRIDSKQIGVEGVSRYGKAALLTMAMDDRFAAVLVGSSGEGGAAPYRRDFGESVENLTASNLSHWMAGNFLKYAAEESSFGVKNANDLPVDSHELVALCAPRLTFISYGIPERGDTLWLDQRGSWMATVAASPVFELLGVKGLGITDDYREASMPTVNQGLLQGHLAWRQHDAGHTDAPNIPAFIEWASDHFDD